jgi:tetratricopeptide (TPR) repeat protein
MILRAAIISFMILTSSIALAKEYSFVLDKDSQVYWDYAQKLLESGKTEESSKYFNQAISMAGTTSEDNKQKIELLKQAGQIYMDYGGLGYAESYFLESLTQSDKLPEGQANIEDIMQNLEDVYNFRGMDINTLYNKTLSKLDLNNINIEQETSRFKKFFLNIAAEFRKVHYEIMQSLR